MIELAHSHHTEIFCAFGEKGLRSEVVADRVVQEAQHYLASGASIGEHLADQLMLPLALAGAGGFTTTTVSSHLQTNMQVVQRFLPVEFAVTRIGENYQVRIC
jgi:RNA 3'-terminal phosphate cyclase (ATP)